MLIAGYSAYPRKVNFATMREIADDVGAVLMVDMAHFAGLVAGKVFTGDSHSSSSGISIGSGRGVQAPQNRASSTTNG